MPELPFEMTVQYPLTAQAAGADYMFDLPNEPFSYLDFCLEGQADADDTKSLSIEDILSQIDLISIRLNGADIIALTGEEIAIYAMAVSGFVPILTFHDLTINQMFNLTIRIPFSRKAYDPKECYPATPSGSSQCRVQIIDAFTCLDNLSLEVVAARLPGANPKFVITQDRIMQTIGAIGQHDIPLTVQFPYAGLLMFSGAIPHGIAITSTIRYLSLFEDSDQIRLHEIPWQHLRNRLMELMRNFGWLREHVHKDIGESYAQGQLTSANISEDNNFWDHFAYVDFDPTLDYLHVMDINRTHSLIARLTSDVVGNVVFYPVIFRLTSDMVRR